jgi:hypothetical protein
LATLFENSANPQRLMTIGQPGVGKTDFVLQHHPLLTGSTSDPTSKK